MTKDKEYIEIKFYKLWKHVRITRQQKEAIKRVLFSFTPFLFYKLASYQNWKNAQVFADQKKSGTIEKHPVKERKPPIVNKLAVVFHVFYFDVFKQMVSVLLKDNNVAYWFFVTCPQHLHDGVETVLKDANLTYKILDVENRGRDILPFLKILPLVFEQDFDIVLKIHTKKSNHLNKKDLWSTDLFDKLLISRNVKKILSVFENYPEVGMIGPTGHILPMSLYYGGNALVVEKLCTKMGLEPHQLHNLNFVAGSMFYVRKAALLPILKLGLTELDFEDEDKQLDNTMAHAVERAFAASLRVSKLKLVDSSSNSKGLSCKVTFNHPFTI